MRHGQCSKDTWVTKVVSSEASFIPKLFLNPTRERKRGSATQSLNTRDCPGHGEQVQHSESYRSLEWGRAGKQATVSAVTALTEASCLGVGRDKSALG